MSKARRPNVGNCDLNDAHNGDSSGVHPSLLPLEKMCENYDALCDQSQHLTDPKAIKKAEDDLWDITKLICDTVDRLETSDGLADDLQRFRKGPFAELVVKWCRMNPHADRLWAKPAGYSGDFQTIELLCQNRKSYDRFIDVIANHLVGSQMGEQHRGKVLEQAEFILEKLRDGGGRDVEEPTILDIGCGPCFDLRHVLGQAPCDVRASITVVDLDREAIRFSEEKLKGIHPGFRFYFLQQDVILCTKSLAQAGQQFNGILFGGLFDYLPDRIVTLVLRLAKRLLKPAGEILFSQVSTANPNRTLMKWLGDWELLERDEDHLFRLCNSAGFQEHNVKFYRDKSGVAILCRLSQA